MAIHVINPEIPKVEVDSGGSNYIDPKFKWNPTTGEFYQFMYDRAKSDEEKSAALAAQGNWRQTMATQGWYEDMSNTAHQREVADLKKAGLNPWLSAGGSGATASAQSAPGNDIASASAAAASGKRTDTANAIKGVASAGALLALLIKFLL